MPRKTKAKNSSARNSRGRRGSGQLISPPSRMGYGQIIKVSANVTLSVSTTGATFVGITTFGQGSGTCFTPYNSGVNYATLSQWGDFRPAKIVLTFIAQVGSGGDPLQIVSALDSTGSDLDGGSATGAFNTIMSRQTAKRSVVTPMQQRPIRHVWRPVEFQNRAWARQADLSESGGSAAPAYAEPWGVLVATFCPASSTSISLYIDWYIEVREPTLSGVLIGKESPETKERLLRLQRQMLPKKILDSSTKC